MGFSSMSIAARTILATTALAPVAGCVTPAPAPTETAAPPAKPAVDQALIDSVNGAWRPADQRARDPWRKPVEVLTFWGVKPGMTVLEIQPGGGAWWTEILAPYAAKSGGRYIAGHADLSNPKISDNARKLRADFEAKFNGQPDVYGQIGVVGFGPLSPPLGAPNSVDLVLTARNVHNWMAAGFADKAFADFYAVLKPGGILAVEEHRADPGDQDPKAPTGYVTEAAVIALAEKAGFKLAGRSDVLANPKDTKDHPFGVWTLPPVRRTSQFGQPDDPKFDRSKYDAIGESDRMALQFVKPA